MTNVVKETFFVRGNGLDAWAFIFYRRCLRWIFLDTQQRWTRVVFIYLFLIYRTLFSFAIRPSVRRQWPVNEKKKTGPNRAIIHKWSGGGGGNVFSNPQISSGSLKKKKKNLFFFFQGECKNIFIHYHHFSFHCWFISLSLCFQNIFYFILLFNDYEFPNFSSLFWSFWCCCLPRWCPRWWTLHVGGKAGGRGHAVDDGQDDDNEEAAHSPANNATADGENSRHAPMPLNATDLSGKKKK